MTIVVDASVLVTALIDDDDDGDVSRARLLAAQEVAAPELVDIEVVSAIRRHLAHGRIGGRRAESALTHLRRFPLRRYRHRDLIARMWALRDALTTYDATYVALAELLGCRLLTSDAKLAKSALHAQSRAEIELLEIN